jgi:hypothetical protein
MFNELSVDSCETSPISIAVKREEYKKRVLKKYKKEMQNEMKHFPNTDNILPHSKKTKLYTKASRPNIPRGDTRKHLDSQPTPVEIVITPDMYAKREPVLPPEPTIIPKKFIEDTSEATFTHEAIESPINDITPTSDLKESIEEKKESGVLEQPLLIEEPIVDITSEELKTNFMEILVNPSSSANMLKAVVHT